MKRVLSFFVTLLSFIALFIPGYAVAESAYILQPGDVLDVSVWKEPDLHREVLVLPDGTLSFPLIGSVNTSNKTVKQLAAIVTEKLSVFIPNPVVTVSAKQLLGNRIYVLGKVNRPGEYPVNRHVDVLQALSMAGGLNLYAEGEDIQIVRREKGEQISISFQYETVSEGDLTQNIILKAGDVVLVP